jgi:hypothetical protein
MVLLDADWLAVPAREGAVAAEGPAEGEPVLMDEARPAGEGAPVAHGTAGQWHVAVGLYAAVTKGGATLPGLTAVAITPIANSKRARFRTSIDSSLHAMLLGGVEPRLLGSYFGVSLNQRSTVYAAVEHYEAGHRGFPAGGQEQEQNRSAHATSMATRHSVSTEDA